MAEIHDALIQSIEDGLKSVDIPHEFIEEDDVFRFEIPLEGDFFQVKYLIGVRKADYIVRTSAPLRGDVDDDELFLKLATLTAKINRMIPRGNFDIDTDDGEISFRHCVESTGLETPSKEFILSAIAIHQTMWNRFAPCFINLFLNKSADVDDVLRSQKRVPEPDYETFFNL